jgi:hypothetical protein
LTTPQSAEEVIRVAKEEEPKLPKEPTPASVRKDMAEASTEIREGFAENREAFRDWANKE